MKLSDDLEVILKAHSKGYEDGYTRATRATKKLKDEQKKHIPINNRIGDTFSKAGTQAGIFLGPLNALSGRLTSLGVAFNRFNTAQLTFGLAMASIIGLTRQSLSQFSEWESQQLRQEALLKATGYAAGLTSQQLESMAQRNAKATLESVEGMRSAIAQLTTFRAITVDNFERTVKAASDIAATFQNTSLTSAITQVAKALEDPEKGLSSLTRTGVTFTAQQQEQIKAWSDAGEMALAQDAILKQIEGQMSGASSAAAAGLAGKIDTLSQAYQNFLANFERNIAGGQIGGFFIDTFTRGLDNINAELENSLEYQKAQLLQQRRELQQRLEDNPLVFGVFGDGFIQEDIAELEAEINRITDLQIKAGREQIKREKAAETASKKEQQRLRTEREKAELKALRAKGRQSLDILETQFANEEEKALRNYDKRLAQINALKLSEQEIERRGYESLEALQKDFRTKASLAYQKELVALNEKHQRELEETRRQQKRLATEKEKAKKQLAAKKKRQSDEAERFFSDIASLESYYATAQEKLDADHTQRLAKLESLKLKELGLTEKYEALKAGIEQKYRQEKQAQELSQFGELGALVAAFAGFEIKSNQEKFATITAAGEQYFGQMASQSKKAFAIQKAFAIAQAVMNTYQMATASYAALAGIPYIGPILGAGAAAAAIAFGLAQVNQIRSQSAPAGQFHQGIDYVPDTGNYTLLKGERVVDSRLNADLKAYLAKPQQTTTPEINFNLSQLDTNGMENMLRQNSSLIYGIVAEALEDQGRTL